MTVDVYFHRSPSGRGYVGISSSGWRARWRSHVFDARHGSHTPLHRAIRKYGPGAFSTVVLQRCTTRGEAEAAEIAWIDALRTKAPRGYNATDGGEGVSGLIDSVRERIRSAAVGRAFSDETRARMSAAQRGVARSMSSEHKRRISSAHKGKRLTAEARDKLRVANLGKKQSEVTRAKRADSMRAAWARRSAAERSAVGSKISAGKTMGPQLRIAPAWRTS